MRYQLLATDMDGTLLNDQKEISPENIQAINDALAAGKHIVFCSGRCIGELDMFFPLFPKMRYVICESGAGVYDLKNQDFIYHKALDPSHVRQIIDAIEGEDIMAQFMIENQDVLNSSFQDQLERFYMDQYRDHFNTTAIYTDDACRYCADHGYIADKINLYHTSQEERKKTEEKLSALPLSMAYSEITSLEISPKGVDKGVALTRLCEHLGIPLEESIAIGDSFNDLSLFHTAGLPIAMENAIPELKELSGDIVADCNHSGVAEAIKKYLSL